MKLMVVLPRVPYPLDKGDKLRAYHMLHELSLSCKLYVCCIADSAPDKKAEKVLSEFCEEVHFFPISKMRSAAGALQSFFNGKPLQVGYFYSAAIHGEIVKQASRIEPDKIIFQLVRTAQYSEGLPADKLVIDYMDAFSEGYKRMAEKSFGLNRCLYAAEAKRLRQYETDVFNKFSKHLIISAQDRELIQNSGRHTIEVISNGVDTHYFQPNGQEKIYDLHFHGNMSYLPNIDCAQYIARQLLPELNRRGTKVRLLISGAAPHATVKALAKRNETEVTGWIEDVRQAYSASKIFIAPLQLGTGIQNKILEAIAMGVPCVISAGAAKALLLQHGKHVLIGNTPAEYCDHIEFLLKNRDTGKKLADAALAHVQQNFKWADNMKKLIRFIAEPTHAPA